MKSPNLLAPDSNIILSIGRPEHDRRLTDKILGAFNHAYANGDVGVAATLRRALEEAELGPIPSASDRRLSTALLQADLWVEFVEARKAYHRATERDRRDPAEIEESRLEMIEAYRRWSDR